MKNNYFLLTILIAGLTLVTLPNKLYAQETKKVQTTKGASTKYTCTHHPEVVSDKPGKCPKCGMDLVPMKSTASTTKPGSMQNDRKGSIIKDSMSHKHPVTKRDKTKMKKDSTKVDKK